MPEMLIAVSSDPAHFHPDVEAQRIDAAACRTILAGRPHLIACCNSGDTAGNRQCVVDYACFAIYEDSEAAHG